MKITRPLLSPLALAAALAVSGCGGSVSTLQDARPLGEGNIPIGRASESVVGQAVVEMKRGATVLRTFVRNGEFRFPRQEPGVAEITVRPVDRLFHPYTFTTQLGQEQRYIANVRPVRIGSSIQVRDFTTDLTEGQVFNIGDTFDLNVRVDGLGGNTLAPSVWVSGGVGRLSPDDKFTATASGTGKIVIELMGRKQEYNVRVR
jgi:hypothetical protein